MSLLSFLTWSWRLFSDERKDDFVELRKENIHRIGVVSEGAVCGTTASFTLDDDFNVPDTKPDAGVS